MKNIYVDGQYSQQNPNWHQEDSAWKAQQILGIIRRHNLQPKSICEIGCGAGEILAELHKEMKTTSFTGYELSPQAYELCVKREAERLRYSLSNLLDTEARFDVLLCIDVFEHVPDYLSFLEGLRRHAKHFVFHIPLDLSLLSMVRPQRLLQTRYEVGHLHMFSCELALAVLKDTGFEVVQSVFTSGACELSGGRRRLRTFLANIPRYCIGAASKRLSTLMFGGYSLLVLAK
jgi:SAM-dependent methyltransferase